MLFFGRIPQFFIGQQPQRHGTHDFCCQDERIVASGTDRDIRVLLGMTRCRGKAFCPYADVEVVSDPPYPTQIKHAPK